MLQRIQKGVNSSVRPVARQATVSQGRAQRPLSSVTPGLRFRRVER